jgi:YbbR domain-containing protein
MNAPSASSALGALRRFAFQDLGLKLTSLIAAIVLFSFVHGAEDAQKSIYVDLITLLPSEESGRMLVSDVPVRVRVTLKGSRSQLNAIRQEQLPPVQIDLRNFQGTDYYFSEDDLDLPVGIDVVQWVPASIPLEYAVRVDRRLPVEPRFEEDLPEGVSFGRVLSIEPSVVHVSGPEDELEAVQDIPTDPISLSRLTPGEHQVRVRLVRPPEHSEYHQTTTVLVRFTLISERRVREFDDLAVSAIGAHVRRIRPSRVDVRLRGTPAVVDGIDPDHVIPYVDASEASPDRGSLPLPVQIRGLPSGVEVVGVEPSEVIVSPGS